ncbi:gastrin/cholecystokinin-like peptide [Lissotriton helveticus]
MATQLSFTVLLTVLAAGCLAMPMMPDSQMLDMASSQRDLRRSAASSELSRRDLLNSLSPEERHFLLQAFPNALADLSNKDHEMGPWHPMHDRDYEGWMDFGRRSVDDLLQSS